MNEKTRINLQLRDNESLSMKGLGPICNWIWPLQIASIFPDTHNSSEKSMALDSDCCSCCRMGIENVYVSVTWADK